MFGTRSIYESLVKLCKELINKKKALIEENEGLKETLRCIRQDNQELREKLFSKTKDEKLDALEKRVEYLEDRLSPVELGVKMTEEKLEVGKWYHTDNFTLEKLKELLPIGTTVMVEQDVAYDNIETKPPLKVRLNTVKEITTRNWSDKPLINVGEVVNREWFKIIKG